MDFNTPKTFSIKLLDLSWTFCATDISYTSKNVGCLPFLGKRISKTLLIETTRSFYVHTKYDGPCEIMLCPCKTLLINHCLSMEIILTWESLSLIIFEQSCPVYFPSTVLNQNEFCENREVHTATITVTMQRNYIVWITFRRIFSSWWTNNNVDLPIRIHSTLTCKSSSVSWITLYSFVIIWLA